MLNFSTEEIELIKNDWFLIGDMFDFLCEGSVGIGTSRSVYNFRLAENMVIKIENNKEGFFFYNASEFDVWTNIKIKHPELSKFLAPCVRISSCGRILLQEKTTPITKEELPKRIPGFIFDLKRENWGKLADGRVVCHDYANHSFFSKADTRLVKPNWTII